MGGVYGYLDATPKGRNEPPGGNLTAWVRRHDEYEENRVFRLPFLSCRLGLSEEEPMPALSLDHWNVFCKDLKATVKFYEKYVGLHDGDRPPFNFPGAWLYAGEKPILHLVSETGRKDHGSGAIDHVAINCSDIRATIDKVKKDKVPYEVRKVPARPLSRFSCTIQTA